MITIVAALDSKGGIGYQNKLPWYLPEDLQRFKSLTLNNRVVMGRKTYESIGRPLPDRTNIIVTHDKYYQARGCLVVNSLDVKLQDVFIIGGSQIYKQFIPRADILELTHVLGTFKTDAKFPFYHAEDFILTQESEVKTDLNSGVQFQFKTYQRKPK